MGMAFLCVISINFNVYILTTSVAGEAVCVSRGILGLFPKTEALNEWEMNE